MSRRAATFGLASFGSVLALAIAFWPHRTGPSTADAQSAAGSDIPGVTAVPIATGLSSPVAFAFLPDGRIVYGDRLTGQIRILDPVAPSDTLFFDLPGVVHWGEHGLLGLAVNPRYPARPYLYAYYTRWTPTGPRNALVRLKDLGGHADRSVTFLTARAGIRHDGGPLGFGPDSKLYVEIGDGHRRADAQNLAKPTGKVLRLTGDGAVPGTNPFPGSFVFSYGHRNMFGLAFDPATGTLWITENGPECNDEAGPDGPGENHGWGPAETCSTPPEPPANTNQDGPDPVLPAWWWTPAIAPTGAAFCDGCGLGDDAEGTLLVGDFNTGSLHRLTLTVDRTGVLSDDVLYVHPSPILALAVAPDGTICFTDPTGIYRLVLA